MRILLPLASFLFSVSLGSAQIPVLKASDVVFMYGAGKEVYQDYGATVLAWGGTPKPAELAEASGLKYFGSVGMVTEFNRYHERFPDTYEQGLCRDLKGQPYKVPWLTDQQHKGVPYWWCCTRQPLFRQYISERVVETVKAVTGLNVPIVIRPRRGGDPPTLLADASLAVNRLSFAPRLSDISTIVETAAPFFFRA